MALELAYHINLCFFNGFIRGKYFLDLEIEWEKTKN